MVLESLGRLFSNVRKILFLHELFGNGPVRSITLLLMFIWNRIKRSKKLVINEQGIYHGEVIKMPVAVVANTTQRFDLESLPEGYVVIRRMTYGESLKRQGISTRFLVSGNTGGSKEFSGELDIQSEAIAMWDFANLVVEHNLTDVDERPLDFKKASDVAKLDGPIGDEIGKLIDTFNSVKESEEVKNS